MNTEPVFVYGTLRNGGSNHFRMAGADFLGTGRISGKIHRVTWYPALVCGGESSVKGELYRVSETLLAELDKFEGITPDAGQPREYRRITVPVNLQSGEPTEAFVWEWIGSLEEATPLDGDDWLAYEPNPS